MHTLGRRSTENFNRVSNPNCTEAQSSKLQNPNKIPKHFTAALTVDTVKLFIPNSTTNTPAASLAFGAEIPPGGTKGSVMAKKDNKADKAVGSKVSEAEALSTADIAAAKYAAGVRGRDSDSRMERMATAEARRWRCCGAEDLA